MARLSGRRTVELLADPGTVESWDEPLEPPEDADPQYRASLRRAAQTSGADESVLTCRITLGGVGCLLVAWEFAFLGGSLGLAASARLVHSIRRATEQRLPVVLVTRSGGTRMQEGTPAFIQMLAIAAAVGEHRAAGLPFLVHLGHPTTGGVLATVGSGGDITTAEPGALVGFLGPRAVQAITGHQLSPGIQQAENLVRHGLIDGLAGVAEVRALWVDLLHVWQQSTLARAAAVIAASTPALPGPATPIRAPTGYASGGRALEQGRPTDPEQLWAAVKRTRSGPGAAKWVGEHVQRLVPLRGDGAGQPATGALVGPGLLGTAAVMVLATVDDAEQPLGVGGLRTMRRGVALANRWGLPILTIVDTLGAELSAPAEEAGITRDIACLLGDLVAAEVPSVALLLGAGTGGAALALLGTDQVVAAGHAWVAPLAPEGAAAIQQSADSPAQVAWGQRIGAHSLGETGFVHAVVDSQVPDWERACAGAVLAALDEARAERAGLAGDTPDESELAVAAPVGMGSFGMGPVGQGQFGKGTVPGSRTGGQITRQRGQRVGRLAAWR